MNLETLIPLPKILENHILRELKIIKQKEFGGFKADLSTIKIDSIIYSFKEQKNDVLVAATYNYYFENKDPRFEIIHQRQYQFELSEALIPDDIYPTEIKARELAKINNKYDKMLSEIQTQKENEINELKNYIYF